jgi:hypothetical protein
MVTKLTVRLFSRRNLRETLRRRRRREMTQDLFFVPRCQINSDVIVPLEAMSRRSAGPVGLVIVIVIIVLIVLGGLVHVHVVLVRLVNLGLDGPGSAHGSAFSLLQHREAHILQVQDTLNVQ